MILRVLRPPLITPGHLILTPTGGPMIIDQLLNAAGLRLKLMDFSLQFIQLGSLFANVLFNS